MAEFICRLGTPAGEVVTRTVEAAGVQEARVRLESEGFRVVTTRDGASAYALALRTRPDLLIADNLMPGLDGVTLIRRLRHVCPRLPILLMSGYKGVSREAWRVRAFSCLHKPLDLDELVIAVGLALGHP